MNLFLLVIAALGHFTLGNGQSKFALNGFGEQFSSRLNVLLGRQKFVWSVELAKRATELHKSCCSQNVKGSVAVYYDDEKVKSSDDFAKVVLNISTSNPSQYYYDGANAVGCATISPEASGGSSLLCLFEKLLKKEKQSEMSCRSSVDDDRKIAVSSDLVDFHRFVHRVRKSVILQLHTANRDQLRRDGYEYENVLGKVSLRSPILNCTSVVPLYEMISSNGLDRIYTSDKYLINLYELRKFGCPKLLAYVAESSQACKAEVTVHQMSTYLYNYFSADDDEVTKMARGDGEYNIYRYEREAFYIWK